MRWLALFMVLLASPSAAEQICKAQVMPVAAPLNACLGTARVRIAAVGDVLLHRPLQRRGYSDAQGFYSIWEDVAPLFHAADLAYANLEGPVAPGTTRAGNNTTDPGPVFDDRVYSSFPMFNYHPRVIDDLQRAGIDIVSTANNHTMDRGPLGADRTIDQLRAAKLPFTGSVKRGEIRAFTAVTSSALGPIAWIACSYSTNGLPDPSRQVLMCFEDREELLRLVTQTAKRSDISAVIVTPHWGYEYNHSANARQKRLAAELIAAGASTVIGTHPHVVQPWEALPGPFGAQGLVIYSTGNFVSGQTSLARRTGALAWLELCQPRPHGSLAEALSAKLVVGESGWVPLRMIRDTGGPRLKVGADAGREAAQLLARYLPENGISASVQCHALDATLVALQ